MIVFTLDGLAVVQLILSVFMPIAVGLVTTRVTSSSKKAWLLAGLTLATSLLTGFGAALASGIPFDIGMAAISAIPAFAVSVAMHYGLWKPTKISEMAQEAFNK